MSSCFQIQAKIIAVIEMVLSIIFLIIIGLAFGLVTTQPGRILKGLEAHNGPNMTDEYTHMKELLEMPTTEQISTFLIPMIYFITEFALGLFLYRSADKNQHKRLRIWFTITITLTLVGAVVYLMEILRNPDFVNTLPILIANFAFTCYSLGVVHVLISEIKSNGYHHPVPYNGYNYKL